LYVIETHSHITKIKLFLPFCGYYLVSTYKIRVCLVVLVNVGYVNVSTVLVNINYDLLSWLMLVKLVLI